MERIVIKSEAEVVEIYNADEFGGPYDSMKIDFPFEPDWSDVDGIVAECEARWPGAAIEVR